MSSRPVQVGMNQITSLKGIESLSSLDILDVHSNRLEDAEGLRSTTGLRIANLGGKTCMQGGSHRGGQWVEPRWDSVEDGRGR